MPLQQQEFSNSIKNDNVKADHLLAYIMLCTALNNNVAEISGNDIKIIEFCEEDINPEYLENNPPLFNIGEHGKPYLTNYEGIFFNISHCKEAVAVCVGGHELGIDVEGRRRFSTGLLQRAFNDEEQETIVNAAEPEKEFARQWTRKEAWFKYTGTGILLDHMKETATEADAAKCQITTYEIKSDSIQGLSFWLSLACSKKALLLSENHCQDTAN